MLKTFRAASFSFHYRFLRNFFFPKYETFLTDVKTGLASGESFSKHDTVKEKVKGDQKKEKGKKHDEIRGADTLPHFSMFTERFDVKTLKDTGENNNSLFFMHMTNADKANGDTNAFEFTEMMKILDAFSFRVVLPFKKESNDFFFNKEVKNCDMNWKLAEAGVQFYQLNIGVSEPDDDSLAKTEFQEKVKTGAKLITIPMSNYFFVEMLGYKGDRQDPNNLLFDASFEATQNLLDNNYIPFFPPLEGNSDKNSGKDWVDQMEVPAGLFYEFKHSKVEKRTFKDLKEYYYMYSRLWIRYDLRTEKKILAVCYNTDRKE